MATAFGSLLRQLREEAGMTLGEFARQLGVSITYLSDVERGRRSPFSEARLQSATSILDLRPPQHQQLLAAAAESRGYFELPTSHSPAKQELGAALARGWTDLDESQARRLLRALDKEED